MLTDFPRISSTGMSNIDVRIAPKYILGTRKMKGVLRRLRFSQAR